MNSGVRAAARSRGGRIISTSVVAAVALGGVGVLAAPGAQAATDPPVVISAPSAVWSGQAFWLHCAIKPRSVGKSWAGLWAKVQEKGVPVNARRTISSNGICNMRLVLNRRGHQKIRVVAYGANNRIGSTWINIHVR